MLLLSIFSSKSPQIPTGLPVEKVLEVADKVIGPVEGEIG